jgi:regulation of enolase protein 1 (concanavalin A-like superfamily)
MSFYPPTLKGAFKLIFQAGLLLLLTNRLAAQEVWQSADIGATGISGSTTYNNTTGQFTVKGAGANVWGSADACHYSYREFSGDVGLVVRVQSVEYVNEWTKAGIMVRESVATGAKNVYLAQTTLNGATFQLRRLTNGDSVKTVRAGVLAPQWLKLTRRGDVFSGYCSADGVNWTFVGSDIIQMSSQIKIGLAVCSLTSGWLATGVFDNWSAQSGEAAQLLPAPWSNTDIGITAVMGQAGFAQGKYILQGSGAGIGTNKDSFQYVFQPLMGNGRITARLEGLSGLAGLVIRDGLQDNARQIFIGQSGQQQVNFNYRKGTGGNAVNVQQNAPALLNWLQLERQGSTLIGRYSDDGNAWQELGRETLDLPENLYIGMNVAGSNAQAEFGNVTVGGITGAGLPEPWLNNDIGNVGTRGSTSYLDGVFTLKASGTDISGLNDAFHFAYQPFVGDGWILARVKSLGGGIGDGWAKAGVMIRGGMASSADEVMLRIVSGNTVRLQYRTQAGGDTGGGSTFSMGTPRWLMLEKYGRWAHGYESANGTDWNYVGSVQMKEGGEWYAGLAGSSHNHTYLNTAQFDHVQVTIGGTPRGLLGEYYNAGSLEWEARRIDPQVNFDWQGQAPIEGLGGQNYSVRWIGEVQPRFSGNYTFYTVAEAGSRLSVDGQVLVEDWNQGGAERGGVINLQAGQRYHLELEYRQGTGSGKIALKWSSANQAKEVIPQASLYPAQPEDQDGNGLPDWWEKQHFGQVGIDPNAPSPAGNGLTIMQAYRSGLDPNDYYSQPGGQVLAVLSIISGNNQNGAPDQFLGQPLTVKVTDSQTGLPLANAPVSFGVTTQGGGKFAMQPSLAVQQYNSLELRTGANGEASVYYLQPAAENTASQVAARSGLATPVFFAMNTGALSVPSAVADLTAQEQEDGSVVLGWQNTATNATAIKITRSDDGGASWQQIASLAPDTTAYTDNTFKVSNEPVASILGTFVLAPVGNGVNASYGATPANSQGNGPTQTTTTIPVGQEEDPSPSYAVIDLGENYSAYFVNDQMQAVLGNTSGYHLYDSGTKVPIAVPENLWFTLHALNNQGVVLGSDDWFVPLDIPFPDGSGEARSCSFIWSVETGLRQWQFVELSPFRWYANWRRTAFRVYDINDNDTIVGEGKEDMSNNSESGWTPVCSINLGLTMNLDGQITRIGDEIILLSNPSLDEAGGPDQTGIYPYAINNNGVMLTKQDTWPTNTGGNKALYPNYNRALYIDEYGQPKLKKTEYHVRLSADNSQKLDGEPQHLNDAGLIVGLDQDRKPILWESGSNGNYAPKAMKDGIVGPVNNKGQVIGGMTTYYNGWHFNGGSHLWQNDKRYAFSQLIPEERGWKDISASDINNHGVILANAIKTKDADGNLIPADQQKQHAVLLVPVDIKFMKQDDWDKELPEAQVMLFDDKTRIKIRSALPFQNLDQWKQFFGEGIKIKTFGTKPEGAVVVFTGSNSTFTSGTGYSEIKIELTRQQLKDLECLPQNDEDGIEEKSWIDLADGSAGSSSNINDSLAFAQAVSGTLRGSSSSLPESGNLDSVPPNSPPDKAFVVAGGAEIITAEIKNAVSKRRQIANQADVFYYSGHGQPGGSLAIGGIQPENVKWNREMKIAILAGCSVLDINDYNQNGKYSVADGVLTPGERWNQTGPHFLLGYNHTAPSDEQNSDQIVANWAANRGSQGVAMAWMNANDRRGARNACAIEKDTIYYYFHRKPVLPGYYSRYELRQVPVNQW